METFFAVAWGAGVIEGVAVMSNTRGKMQPQFLIPAVLYGTLSLPLGLFGASPGPSTIDWLPFSPKSSEILMQQGISPTATAGQQNSPTEADMGDELHSQAYRFRRVDFLREENRRHARTVPVPMEVSIASPASTKAPSVARQYLAALDGRGLPTPMAEAMRRMRFLCVGAGLVGAVLSHQSTQTKDTRKDDQAVKMGKDPAVIHHFVSKSQHGAVLRWNGSEQPISVSSRQSNVVTIALQSPSIDQLHFQPFWNPGRQPQEWSAIPISSDWMLHTKTNETRLVLEANVTPALYFGPDASNSATNSAHSLSQALLMFQTISASVLHKRLVSSTEDTIAVVLGSTKPVMPLPDSVIYMDSQKGLGIEVNTVLERLYTQDISDFMDVDDEDVREQDDSSPIELPPRRWFSIGDAVLVVDLVGLAIRQVLAWPASYLAKWYSTQNDRVVHVLSDQEQFIHFLQSALQDWRIIWYDATKENDVRLYVDADDVSISIVYCSTDAITSAFLSTVRKPKTLAILQEPNLLVPSGVAIVSIQEVHNNLFAKVRDQLLDGKTAKEIQELIDMAQ